MRKAKWPGSWAYVCQSCGFEFPSEDIKLRWDGLRVCKKDWEPKHPQLLIKIREETAVPAFVNSPGTAIFATYCDINGNSAFADMGTADCMQADKVSPTYRALLDTLTGNGF